MGSIVIDPSNPLIVYAGTGEENFTADSYYGCGVLKSLDGGASWTQMGAAVFATTSGGARIGKIVIRPTATSTLVVASSFGLYRSVNGGVSFTQVLAGTATDVSDRSGFSQHDVCRARQCFWQRRQRRQQVDRCRRDLDDACRGTSNKQRWKDQSRHRRLGLRDGLRGGTE